MRIPAPRPLVLSLQVQWLRRHMRPRHLRSTQRHMAMAMATRHMWTPMSCARCSSQASCFAGMQRCRAQHQGELHALSGRTLCTDVSTDIAKDSRHAGFPPDVKERELNNLMRFLPGYEVERHIWNASSHYIWTEVLRLHIHDNSSVSCRRHSCTWQA